MLKNMKKIICPQCGLGHIADVPIGTKFRVIDIRGIKNEELKNKVILKCPKGPHYAAFEII